MQQESEMRLGEFRTGFFWFDDLNSNLYRNVLHSFILIIRRCCDIMKLQKCRSQVLAQSTWGLQSWNGLCSSVTALKSTKPLVSSQDHGQDGCLQGIRDYLLGLLPRVPEMRQDGKGNQLLQVSAPSKETGPGIIHILDLVFVESSPKT